MTRAAGCSIRPAEAADAPAIAAMSRDLIEEGLGWSWRPERVRKRIADTESLAVVALERDRVCGFAIVHFGDDEGHVELLAVARDVQRRGTGRRLIEWVVASARCAGLRSLRLELRATNLAAQGFYRSLGFRAAGLVPGYYRGVESAMRMTRALCVPGAPDSVAWEPPAAWWTGRPAGGDTPAD